MASDVTTAKNRKAYVRRVWERCWFKRQDDWFCVEMSKTGITVRQKYHRQREVISFAGLMDAIEGQLTMKL